MNNSPKLFYKFSEMSGPVPVVDFSECALTSSSDLESEHVKRTVDLIAEGLEQIGCVYLINHGLGTEELQTLRATARAYFALPVEEKVKNMRNRDHNCANGWIGEGMEVVGAMKDDDLKECFDVNISQIDTFPWPSDDLVPGFRDVNRKFIKKLNVLIRRLFELMGKKFCPQEPTILTDAHKGLETEKNGASVLRSIFYPPTSQYREIQPGQLRCDAHSDYGMFTLLFQDMVGGLQAVGSDGKWFDVEPLDGAILLQAGDLLEIWTAGRVKATVHRVITPTGEKANLARESTVYFVQPDDDFLVRCLDGSDKYASVKSRLYFDGKVHSIQASNEENRVKMMRKK